MLPNGLDDPVFAHSFQLGLLEPEKITEYLSVSCPDGFAKPENFSKASRPRTHSLVRRGR